MRINPSLLSLALLTACRPPEAPDTIEEMMVYGFTHHADDEAHIIALADKLIPFMEAHEAELAEGYEVSSLTTEDLAAAEVSADAVDGVVGAAVGMFYTVDLDAVAFGLSYPDQDEIFESYVEFERTQESPRACFLDRTCPTHDSMSEVHASLGLGIEMWNEFSQDLRWVESEEHGRLLVVRVLGPTPVQFNIDFLQVHQQYSFSFVYQHDDGAASRVQAIWVDGEVVNGDMPESTALNLGISTMVNSAEDLDAWLVAREEGL